jgi:hypothetical protein
MLADKATRSVGAPNMVRAVDLVVNRARDLVFLADDALAARTTLNFVRADDLTGASFAVSHAVVAKASHTARCCRVGIAGVGFAHNPSAMRT